MLAGASAPLVASVCTILPGVCLRSIDVIINCTGETMPDEGSAFICGHSMQREMARARQLVGYCPQFDALAGTLTGNNATPSAILAEVLLLTALL